MKFSLRDKIIGANLLVLFLAFLVVGATVLEGLNAVNTDMVVKNMEHQADVSIVYIKQSLLSDNENTEYREEFETRSRDFTLRLSIETGLRILIFSTSKELLSDSLPGRNSPPDFNELDRVLEGNRAYTIRSAGSRRELYFAFPIMLLGDTLGAAILVYPMDTLDMTFKSIQLLLLVSFVAGTAVILLVSLLVSSRIVLPLKRLTASAMQISAGNYQEKITVKTSDEMGALAEAFNTMSGEIEKRMETINFERNKLNSVLENMGEGVIALDREGATIAENTKARTLMTESVRSELDRAAEAALLQGSRIILEKVTRDKSIIICATPLITENSVKGVVIVLNDVTELRLLQDKQRQFLTNVSHELKTPLTTIIGYVELLSTKGEDKEVFEASVRYLKSAGDRLLKLVEDLIDLSSLNRLEFDIEPKSTDIALLVKDIVGQMSLKANKFNITVSADLQPVGDILADPQRIKQALVNVLDNAIKYSPGGRINIFLRREEGKVFLEIRDSGCGIPADRLSRIFEPFYRVDRARSRSMGGNGLGLAIAKEIIEKHGGAITLESEEGKGTTVEIVLPG